MEKAILKVEQISKTYGKAGEGRTIIEGMSFEVLAGEMVCIVGKSGIGKTTLLNCLSGLAPVTSGAVVLNGERVAKPPRELTAVFQDYRRSLMPWKTAEGNVMMPLRHGLGLPKAEARERTAEALRSVGLADCAHLYPWQMSGGMQQRVSIARAIAYRPSILLLDEPFASVDAQTRFELEDLLLNIRRDLSMTMLLVTHDIDEAVYLGDRVVVVGGAPASVERVFGVPLPATRDQVRTRALPEFASLRSEILEMIRG